MGLHISRVEVKNYRNFADLSIDKLPARAVIVGENGVGKSNLLEAMRLVLDPALPDTRRMLREEDVFDGHATGIAGGVEVTIVVDPRDTTTTMRQKQCCPSAPSPRPLTQRD